MLRNSWVSNWLTMRMPSAWTRCAAGRVVVALGDDHVAAVPAAAVEVAAGGGACFHRRDHLEQLVADGQQRVLQAEAGDAGVAIADRDTEHAGEHALSRRELPGHQGDLP
jgi:hypothetical protein